MLAASKVKISGSEKENEQEHKQIFFVKTYDISSLKGATRKFHVVVVQQQWQRNVQKSVLHVQSCFLLIRPIIVVVVVVLFCFFFVVVHNAVLV